MTIKIKDIFYGKEIDFSDKKRGVYKTSYKKQKASDEKLFVDEFGILGDYQSDKENHGGVDRAICVYSQKNYDFFKEKYDLNLSSCSFGENFTIEGFDDSQIFLGDRFSCGEAIFEVSQPRQPCWKISSITSIKNLTALTVKEAKTGFLLRVIKTGYFNPKDDLKLISRPHPNISIELINICTYKAKENQEKIKEILTCKELASEYREILYKRYKNKQEGLEDFQKEI